MPKEDGRQSGSCRRKVMPYGRKGSGLKNRIPLHSIHFYKTTDPVRHNFLRLDPFLLRTSNSAFDPLVG